MGLWFSVKKLVQSGPLVPFEIFLVDGLMVGIGNCWETCTLVWLQFMISESVVRILGGARRSPRGSPRRDGPSWVIFK